MLFTDPAAQARYDEMVARGESRVLAEMWASRTFPGIRTGGALMRGVATDDGLGDSPTADDIRAAADRNGVSRAGKRWFGTGPMRWDDPRRWYSDEHEVKAIARQLGAGISGAINMAGPEIDGPPPPPVPVADDIVREEIARRIEEDPGLEHRDLRELREQVTEELTLPMASPDPRVSEEAKRIAMSGMMDVYQGD